MFRVIETDAYCLVIAMNEILCISIWASNPARSTSVVQLVGPPLTNASFMEQASTACHTNNRLRREKAPPREHGDSRVTMCVTSQSRTKARIEHCVPL